MASHVDNEVKLPPIKSPGSPADNGTLDEMAKMFAGSGGNSIHSCNIEAAKNGSHKLAQEKLPIITALREMKIDSGSNFSDAKGEPYTGGTNSTASPRDLLRSESLDYRRGDSITVNPLPWAKADRMGFLIDGSDEFLRICMLERQSIHTCSLATLAKLTSAESVQQQAYVLNDLAYGTADKGTKWVAELHEAIDDKAFTMCVTTAENPCDAYALDVVLTEGGASSADAVASSHYVVRKKTMARMNSMTVHRSGRTKLNVLIVDDSPIAVKVLAKVIRGDGHVVDCQLNSLAAVEQLKKTNYDVLFMSLDVPGMKGVQASAELRMHEDLMRQYKGESCEAKLRIIAMIPPTVNDMQKAELVTAGFDTYLVKPITLQAFRDLKLKPTS